MKSLRTASFCASALVLALSFVAPAPVSAQQPKLSKAGTGYLLLAAANAYQVVRVTVGNPTLVAPSEEEALHLRPIFIDVVGVDGDVGASIEPGGSYTYTIDPRVSGRLVDPKTGLRHVPVHFEVDAEVEEGQKPPTPSITIEIVNSRTGEVQSFHAFPGFVGGVSVAAGDVN